MEQFNTFHEATAKSMEDGLQVLHKQWGEDYDTRLKAAVQMKEQLKEKFPDQMGVLLATNANNPALAHILSELAFSYQEQGVIGQPRIEYGETPDSAKQKIAAKQKDADFMKAYQTESHPAHNAAVEEMKQLYALAYSQR
jgi:hypothetical protein